MSTINGRTFTECLEALRTMRPDKEPKGQTGFWYYPIEAFLDAMDQCFGNDRYNIAFSEPVFRAVASGQEMVTVRCTLTITDDEGRVVKSVDGFGDSEVQYGRESKRADLGNLTSSTASFAVKDACKYLGIFGYRTVDGAKDVKQKKGSKAAAAGKSTSTKSAGSDKKTSETVNFVVTDMFYQQGESDPPVFKLPVVKKGDKADAEIVFYHNQTSKKAEKFNEFFAFVESSLREKKGTVTCRFLVTPSGEFNGLPQYVFKDFS